MFGTRASQCTILLSLSWHGFPLAFKTISQKRITGFSILDHESVSVHATENLFKKMHPSGKVTWSKRHEKGRKGKKTEKASCSRFSYFCFSIYMEKIWYTLKRFLKVHFWSLSETYLEPFDGIFLPERQQIVYLWFFIATISSYFWPHSFSSSASSSPLLSVGQLSNSWISSNCDVWRCGPKVAMRICSSTSSLLLIACTICCHCSRNCWGWKPPIVLDCFRSASLPWCFNFSRPQ